MQMEFSDFLIVGFAAFIAIGVLARMMNLKRQREIDRFEAELRVIQQQQVAKQEQELRDQRKQEQADEFLKKRAAVFDSAPPSGSDPGQIGSGQTGGQESSEPASRPAA